jgi:hypothetical protein
MWRRPQCDANTALLAVLEQAEHLQNNDDYDDNSDDVEDVSVHVTGCLPAPRRHDEMFREIIASRRRLLGV